MTELINLLKNAKAAYQYYINNNEKIDFQKCEKILDYIENIEKINNIQKDELLEFINENTFETIHLANIYIDPLEKEFLNKRLTRMIPIHPSKTDGRIYKAKGNFSSLTVAKPKEEVKVKIKRAKHLKKVA